MATLRILVGLLIAAQVAFAGALWPRLPERIPTHFGGDGVADAFGPPDAEWFVISGLLAAAGVVIGYVLPVVARALARANSPLLNVPDRERFQALPVAARERAVGALTPWLLLIAGELQLLTAFLMLGTWRVARGDWDRLPPVVLYGAMAVLLATAIALTVAGSRAARRELRTGEV